MQFVLIFKQNQDHIGLGPVPLLGDRPPSIVNRIQQNGHVHDCLTPE
jgi:hypothetical protein